MRSWQRCWRAPRASSSVSWWPALPQAYRPFDNVFAHASDPHAALLALNEPPAVQPRNGPVAAALRGGGRVVAAELLAIRKHRVRAGRNAGPVGDARLVPRLPLDRAYLF